MGLTSHLTQSNTIYNRHRGTIRGLHWQVGPLADARLFRVIRGAVHDVIADLREGSESYGEWESFRLSADEPRLLYVPECFAQGLQAHPRRRQGPGAPLPGRRGSAGSAVRPAARRAGRRTRVARA